MLPFCLSGEASSCPFGKGFCIIPRDVHDRVIFNPAVIFGAGPVDVPPVRPFNPPPPFQILNGLCGAGFFGEI